MANLTGKGGFRDHPENVSKSGQRNKEAVAFARAIRESLVTEGEQPSKKRKGLTRYQSMIVKVWELAEKGTPWAVDYISDRVEGKVKQDFGVSGDLNLTGNIIHVRDIANSRNE